NLPTGVVADARGNVFIADGKNNVIRKVDRTGKIKTFAGNGTFFLLNSLAIDSAGNLYVGDFCVVWQITPAGVMNIVAGQPGSCGYNGDGIPATEALLSFQLGVAVDSQANLYIADAYNNRVRMVDSQGIINTVAGNGTQGFGGDGGPAVEAMLYTPTDV